MNRLAAREVRSSFYPTNARALRALRVAPEAASRSELDVLFDPQTSGGLLFGVSPDQAEPALEELRAGGDTAAVIGEVVSPRADGALFEVASARLGPPAASRG